MKTKTKRKFRSESVIKDGVHLSTLVVPVDGGTFDIEETKHLNYFSKQFRKIVNPDKIREYFEINPVTMKWEYIISDGVYGLVFCEYDDEIDVYGYSDFENEINPSYTKRIILDMDIEYDYNLISFYTCISEFKKLN